MLSNKFGVEIEFTGITRNKASTIVAKVVNGTTEHLRDGYDTYQIKAADGRKWKIMNDSSLSNPGAHQYIAKRCAAFQTIYSREKALVSRLDRLSGSQAVWRFLSRLCLY